VITLSTVGFSEQFPLSRLGQMWTVAIIVSGLGLVLVTAAALIEQVFVYGASRRQRRSREVINQMSGHVILCGFGRVGLGTWQALARRFREVVVIEIDESRADEARNLGVQVVHGDATHDAVLRQAGLDRAHALIACVTSDSDNLVIVLSARSLAPTLRLVSRASEHEWEPKLRLAGADRVVTPQSVGSERLAAMATEQTISDMFDVIVGGRAIEFTVEEVVLAETSGVVGVTIRESGIRERTGALILAVEDVTRATLTSPDPDHRLEAGAALIVVGTADQVSGAVKMVRGLPD
jgi:voltage-gated potassium channel